MKEINSANHMRMPAEWEPVSQVLLAWPHRDTDWAYMLDRVEACYIKLAEAIVPHAPLVIITHEPARIMQLLSHLPQSRITYAEYLTNDTWIRDFGPITTVDDSQHVLMNDFMFNGWGLKFRADRDNLATRHLMQDGLLPGEYRNRLGFVLEGGSIESDGKGTIMTTSRCLMSPNRNGDLTREEIEQRLSDYLGARKVLWVNHGGVEGDDTDGHIDTLARFAPHDTIIYAAAPVGSFTDYDDLKAMAADIREFRTADGRPFNLIELPMPEKIIEPESGEQLPATYANYLVVNDAVLVPTYNQPQNDRLAIQLIRAAYPDHEVVGVDCTTLICQHGSLHCATMQINS